MKQQKRVTFKIAKALKKAGYPQDILIDNKIFDIRTQDITSNLNYLAIYGDDGYYISAPTYLDVWLWLSEEKNIYISPKHDFNDNNENVWTNGWTTDTYKDPQSAIIAAVEYIITNNYFYDNK